MNEQQIQFAHSLTEHQVNTLIRKSGHQGPLERMNSVLNSLVERAHQLGTNEYFDTEGSGAVKNMVFGADKGSMIEQLEELLLDDARRFRQDLTEEDIARAMLILAYMAWDVRMSEKLKRKIAMRGEKT